jgi:hypothetical protein
MSLSYAPINKAKPNVWSEECALFRGICKYYELKEPRVEFLFGIGSKSTSSADYTEDTKSYLENVNEKVKENFKSNMTKIIQKNATDVSNENSQEMLIAIKSANEFVLSNTKVEGDLKIGGLKQTNEVKVEATMDAANSVTTKVNNETSNRTSNQLTDYMENSTKMGESLTGVMNNAIGAAAGVVNNTVDAAAGVLNTGINAGADVVNNTVNALTPDIGGSTNTSTNTTLKSDDTVINKSSDIAKDTVKLENVIEGAMENNIKSDNLQKCGADLQAANSMVYDSIEVGGTLEISDIEQKNIIESVVNCQFSTEVITEVVNQTITDLSNAIENTDLTIEEQEGFGMALAAAAEGVGSGIGNAAEGVGSGIGGAAEGVGTGVASAAEGVGNMIGSFGYLIIACVCILVFGLIGFVGMGGIEKTSSAYKNVRGF